jgi:hypothetical protein
MAASNSARLSSGMRLGVPPPRYTVSGSHRQSKRETSARKASSYCCSSARGNTPEAKLQKVHFCAQNG